jgi:hypothetical protein
MEGIVVNHFSIFRVYHSVVVLCTEWKFLEPTKSLRTPDNPFGTSHEYQASQ